MEIVAAWKLPRGAHSVAQYFVIASASSAMRDRVPPMEVVYYHAAFAYIILCE